VLTTAICDVGEPTPEIRNGLAVALDRDVEGFEVLSREPTEHGLGIRVTAAVAAWTTVNCLCVDGFDVEVGGVGTGDVGRGGTGVNEGGTVKLEG